MRELEGALRLSQLSALSLLEMSSSESLGVEHGEPLSTSSNLRFRLRADTVSMETRCSEDMRYMLSSANLIGTCGQDETLDSQKSSTSSQSTE